MTKKKWIKPNKNAPNLILERKGYYLSYLDPKPIIKHSIPSLSIIDSNNPETAIVILNDKPNGQSRYLIYRGDWREKLEKIKSLKELKEHWKEYGGHFWSDSLDDEE